MHRFLAIVAAGFVLGSLVVVACADEPAAPAQERTYAVSCKLIRKVRFTNNEGKNVVEAISRDLPEIATIEGTRGEYRSGGKVDSIPYGLHIEVKVTGETKNRVRLEVKAEDGSADGGGFRPVIQNLQSLAVVRRVQLGKPLKLALDQNENGGGVWIELTVREIPAE